MTASREERRRALREVPRAAALVASVVLALLSPCTARADEALLPSPDDIGDPGLSEQEVARIEEPELDPTASGALAPGLEPDGAELAGLLDGYLDEAFPACGMPGAAVAVVDADGVRYLRCLGDVTGADQTFLVGSLSKSMTAVAVMQLVDAGLVSLDDPAGAYAPELGVPGSVTVRDLLNQTSGFGYYESLAEASVGESAGTFSYANANYDLLGHIVEDVSGQSFDAYLREHVFGPLGMDDASAVAGADRAPQAPGHRSWFGAWVADGFEHEEGPDAWGGPSSGYVRASIDDMASYLRMYLNSGEGVLSPDALHQMVFSRVPDPAGDTYYGMGWTTFAWDDGELVMSHDGQVENYVARMCVIPGRSLGVVVLADGNDEFGGNEAFFSLADGVTSIAVGGAADVPDGSARLAEHALYNVVYLVCACAAAAPLACALRGRRSLGAAWEVALHVVLPASLLFLPRMELGMRLRDFCDFYPDQALVLLACCGLLLAGGVVRAAFIALKRPVSASRAPRMWSFERDERRPLVHVSGEARPGEKNLAAARPSRQR